MTNDSFNSGKFSTTHTFKGGVRMELTVSEIKNVKFEYNTPYWLRFIEEHNCLDLFFFPKQSKKLLICAQDALIENRAELPYFYRSKWPAKFEASFITFNDPTLYLDRNLRVGYFLSPNSNELLLSVISEIANQILKLAFEDIVVYGASAGGYWAVKNAPFFRKSSIIIDIPQINLNAFLDEKHKKLLQNSSTPIKKEHFQAFAWDSWSPNLMPQNIIYLQNIDDVIHTRVHYSSFMNHVSSMAENFSETGFIANLLSHFYKNEGSTRGHSPMQETSLIPLIEKNLSKISQI